MGDDFNKNLGITAGVGCATGFLWSALSGKADISTGKGFARAIIGCGGSAFNGASVYTASNYLFDDKTARNVTTAWFGFQSASSFTQMLGNHYEWHDSTAYNLVAFPLNLGAAPLSSSVGLVWGIVGEASAESKSGVSLYGGSLVFRHESCSGNGGIQLGAVMQLCKDDEDHLTRSHELVHQAQYSIMGDFGMAGLTLLNGAGRLIIKQDLDNKKFIIERWAYDYEKKSPTKKDDAQSTRETNPEEDLSWLPKAYQGMPLGSKYNKYFHGGLASGSLSQNYKIRGASFPKGTKVTRQPREETYTFTTKGEIVFKSHPFRKATLNENGEIIYGTLGRDHPLHEIKFRAGTTFHFKENGDLSHVIPSAIHIIDEYPCDQGQALVFHKSGRLKTCVLSTSSPVPGLPVKALGGKRLQFHKNKLVWLATLSEAAVIPVKIKPQSQIQSQKDPQVALQEDEQKKLATLSKDTDIPGIPCAKHTQVTFHNNGQLKEATLSTNHPLNGVPFLKGSTVNFDMKGKLLYVVKPKH